MTTIERIAEKAAREIYSITSGDFEATPDELREIVRFVVKELQGALDTEIEARAAARDTLSTWLPTGGVSRHVEHQWQPSDEIVDAFLDAILNETGEAKP